MEQERPQVYAAKLAEQAERYEDVVKIMDEVAKLPGELTVEERNLLSVAYKNVIGARRSSWRVLGSIEAKEEAKGSTDMRALRLLKAQVEKELLEISSNILGLLDNHLIPNSTSTEAQVFFYKMKGDYHRYVAEFSADQQRKSAADASLNAYESATKAAGSLPCTHPIRLGLALNFSVFYYEILNDPKRACEIAKSAFDQAIAELDSLSEDSYKDSTLIMQLLRDNLTLWTSDVSCDADKDLPKDNRE